MPRRPPAGLMSKQGSQAKPRGVSLDPGRPPRKGRRWRLGKISAPTATIVAAVIGGLFLITAGIGASTSWFGWTASDENGVATTTTSVPFGGGNGTTPKGLIKEWADNHNGSPVFASPAGAPVSGVPIRIPFNTQVNVKCVAPNASGMQSVTAFYLIGDGTWKGVYVVADTMSNGGLPGNTTSPNVDPQVHACP